PQVRKELKICEAKSDKSSIDEPPDVELKDLHPRLEYAFIEGEDKFPVIIAKDLSAKEKTALITVLKSHKRAIAWKLSDIKATRKDHFPLPFMDQMLERLAGNQYYCFLDGFSGYFQIPIDPKDQEKTTFTCPYGTFAYRRMPFGLCNAPSTFQRCMMAIFWDMIEKTMEVFMDNFSVFENSFHSCLSHLDQMLKRYKDTNLCLNWEKSHFMVKEGIVLGHKISKQGIEWIFEMITLSMSHKITLASDTLIDFQIKFSISIGETVTHWFTLIALSALRRSDNENMLSLMNLILMSILTDLQVTPTKPGRMTKPYSSHHFIANCFNAGNIKMEVKGEIVKYMKSIGHSIKISLSPQEANWVIVLERVGGCHFDLGSEGGFFEHSLSHSPSTYGKLRDLVRAQLSGKLSRLGSSTVKDQLPKDKVYVVVVMVKNFSSHFQANQGYEINPPVLIPLTSFRYGLRESVSHFPILTDSIILILVLSSLTEVQVVWRKVKRRISQDDEVA
nr:reverse transcriptase domain-containing protein [Tanacetum cinerariifolium]